ncbi:hypothetical protein THAOC_02388 [Thalassiosira oceanica]|uniref:Uncharacterized protein n=1 Tax=Thalassiosira oceanica TaxID=159749 RepID=K0TM43_THAOC|nr:hypothetical protein THAOC_02388 [Thalassiosira oceanica]|eukprot:EJK75871.1 hypothetical protein THAOC_02388 [Thalassiosira oceanica]
MHLGFHFLGSARWTPKRRPWARAGARSSRQLPSLDLPGGGIRRRRSRTDNEATPGRPPTMHPKTASKQVQNRPVGCLRERGDKANDLKMTLDGVRKGVENDEGVEHDVGGGRGPEFEFPTVAPRPDELTLSLSRNPRTDFGAETGHEADADMPPEQVHISISPSECRHGGGNGDPVERYFGTSAYPFLKQQRDMMQS